MFKIGSSFWQQLCIDLVYADSDSKTILSMLVHLVAILHETTH